MEAEKDNQTSLTVTSKNFIEIYNPEALNRKLVEVRNANDALKIAESYPSKYPSLAKLRTHYGSQKTETIIKLYLVELCELVNLKRPLSEKQIETIAQEVVLTYYMLTIADIHVVFRQAKNGEFGELYESLDMPKVMKWFDGYFSERCHIGMQDSIAHQFKNDNDPRSSFLAKREFDKLEAKMNVKK